MPKKWTLLPLLLLLPTSFDYTKVGNYTMIVYNERNQDDCLEKPWKYIVQLLNIPCGITDFIRCDVLWQIFGIYNSWNEGDVACHCWDRWGWLWLHYSCWR